ncbi:MAG: efflux transporter outer membrane subunit [Desulfarculaceae bacterium]|nr:efflux transporter outer membrane subunit [Desulfarculaceae bacterium]MCF8071737.1 efflux transporter outer membrane subunit [Desulfarculaceae bacterium]MCF8102416.1 efflux transporter outer membrane subunit [Desulfarculaceae bacterium]MCF8116758.1 efflux transporter outer membrane subunit [Desulfarculaceae bacterium]
MTSRLAWALLALVLASPLALGATGCLKVGPDYQRPKFAFKTPATYDQAVAKSPYAKLDKWWEQFGDPQLNQVVQDVLKQNLDLEAAAGRVLELQSAFVVSRSQRFPTVTLEGTGQRQRSVSSVSLPTTQTISGERETYNLSLAASFEVDLWGKLARSEASAKANLLQAEETRRTVAQTVVASAVTGYFNIRALQRRVAVNQQSIDAYKKSVTVVDGRYRRGLTSILDLRQARRSLAQAKAQRPSLEQELGLAKQQLAVLLGRYPQIKPDPDKGIDYLARMKQVPPGLPSELLLRRPDLRAAEAGLVSLSEKIGVARAARFPSITLTGGFGYTSSGLDSLFTPANQLWNLALGLSQPVFNAGRLEAQEKAARARYSQGVADYAKTVLSAFGEVEGALLTRQQQQGRRDLLKDAVQEAVATQDTAQRRYLRGLQDYLSVLEAQQTRYSLADSLVLNEQAILTNRVTLYRVLGGGWAQPPALARAEK